MTWRKLGRVWVPPGNQSWARSHAFVPTPEVVAGSHIRVYCTVLDDEQVGRVTYVDVALDDPTRVLRTAAQPVLDAGAVGCFDNDGVNASSVVDWRGHKWLYYIGWQRAARVPYMLFGGAARSTDGGESFTRVQRVPVLERTDDEPFSRSAPFVLADDARLRMWYWSCREWTTVPGSAPQYNNEINYAESEDGVRWHVVKRGVIRAEGNDYAVGRPWVVRDGEGFRMWFATRSHSPSLPYRIDSAESADGVTWSRQPSPITTSAEGWDSEMVCFAAVVDAGGARLMFYNGNGHGRTGFGVARLERA
jgi:hypothetical protein